VPATVGRAAGRALTAVRRRLPRLTPERVLDLALRAGSVGRGVPRLTLARLRRHPHGLVLGTGLSGGRLGEVARDGRVRLDAPVIIEELSRLGTARGADEEFPLQLIGLRELRSHNSWMHNAPTLMKGRNRRHGMRINPKDAADAGVAEGQPCRVRSAYGEIEVPAFLTDEVRQGTVAIPHGWGHDGGWTTANRAGGANVNLLASTDPEDLERLAGMAVLNGVPVRVEPA
jgi:formate dehydrogenase